MLKLANNNKKKNKNDIWKYLSVFTQWWLVKTYCKLFFFTFIFLLTIHVHIRSLWLWIAECCKRVYNNNSNFWLKRSRFSLHCLFLIRRQILLCLTLNYIKSLSLRLCYFEDVELLHHTSRLPNFVTITCFIINLGSLSIWCRNWSARCWWTLSYSLIWITFFVT